MLRLETGSTGLLSRVRAGVPFAHLVLVSRGSYRCGCDCEQQAEAGKMTPPTVQALKIVFDRLAGCPRATIECAYGCGDFSMEDRCSACLLHAVLTEAGV